MPLDAGIMPGQALCRIINTLRRSLTAICPGAEACFTAPNVAAEPNTSPADVK
ncbi:Uncharacterised protein [Salmonella enterica subsp. arizonae]|uniref:Uncharacterized protein n=1 Tax=Salmonella enterica subsp. arizonae TaxID=59203 RepID=A0A3S4GM37_SALER|nr:Uncharacterised protein [Salmonella enterica subsp. arizonae]